MPVKIRLRRMGARHQPTYRIVVADARSPRDGRFIENIGHYNPRLHNAQGECELYIDPDRALHWLDVGAQPTETTRSLLKRARILELRHDRNHGIDVAERLASMRRPSTKPVKAVAAPVAAAAPVAEVEAPVAPSEPDVAAESSDATAAE